MMALANAGYCERALPLIDEALELVDQQIPLIELGQQANDVDASSLRSSKDRSIRGFSKARGSISNSRAYLYVARSRCAGDLRTMASDATKAIQSASGMSSASENAAGVAGLLLIK